MPDVQRARDRRGRGVDREDLLARLGAVEGVGVVGLPALRPGRLEPLQRRLVRYDDARPAAGVVSDRSGVSGSVVIGGILRAGPGQPKTSSARPCSRAPSASPMTTTSSCHDDAGRLPRARRSDHLALDPVLNTVVASMAEREAARGARDATRGSRTGTPSCGDRRRRGRRASRCGRHRSRRTRRSCCRCRTTPRSGWPGCCTSAVRRSAAANGALPAVAGVRRGDRAADRRRGAWWRMHTRLFELRSGPGPRVGPPARCGWRPRRTPTSRSPGSTPSTRTPTSRPAAPTGTRPSRWPRDAVLRRLRAVGCSSGRWTASAVHMTGATPRRTAPPGSARSTPRASTAAAATRGATVAELSQRILDAGERPCLFTDQANPCPTGSTRRSATSRWWTWPTSWSARPRARP